jgi:hypothetical protein
MIALAGKIRTETESVHLIRSYFTLAHLNKIVSKSYSSACSLI